MKIKVFRQNEFSIHFEMIDDGLPENGDYHLVPVGKENIFVAEYLKNIYQDVLASNKLAFKVAQLEQQLELLHEKIRKVKIT